MFSINHLPRKPLSIFLPSFVALRNWLLQHTQTSSNLGHWISWLHLCNVPTGNIYANHILASKLATFIMEWIFIWHCSGWVMRINHGKKWPPLIRRIYQVNGARCGTELYDLCRTHERNLTTSWSVKTLVLLGKTNGRSGTDDMCICVANCGGYSVRPFDNYVGKAY